MLKAFDSLLKKNNQTWGYGENALERTIETKLIAFLKIPDHPKLKVEIKGNYFAKDSLAIPSIQSIEN